MATINIPVTVTANISGGYLTVRVNTSVVKVKIEDIGIAGQRQRLQQGTTVFDLVLEAAKTFVTEYHALEFSAADIFHVATERHPELNLRQNTWSCHVVSSAPNHPSYKHYTAHRRYFRYLGKGKYSLDPSMQLQAGSFLGTEQQPRL